jgi:hypothetical protein
MFHKCKLSSSLRNVTIKFWKGSHNISEKVFTSHFSFLISHFSLLISHFSFLISLFSLLASILASFLNVALWRNKDYLTSFMYGSSRMIQLGRRTTRNWLMTSQSGSMKWNEMKWNGVKWNEMKWNERETNKELKQIRFSSSQENDKDLRMREKRIQMVCDNRSDLVMVWREQFPVEIKRKQSKGWKPRQSSIPFSAENAAQWSAATENHLN